MKDANKILEDAALDLAVQLIDTNKQARDLEDAFDITTDSSLDVAKAEVSLTKAIKSKTNAIGRSIETIDTAAYTQRDTAQIERDYQDALVRRTKLETDIAKQRPIIDYANDNADKLPKKEKPSGDKENLPKQESVKDKTDSLSEYLDKKNLGDIKKFKTELDKVKDEQNKQRGLFKKIAIGGLSATAGLAIGGGKATAGFIGSSLENAMGLQQIPLYNESKQLTKFALNKTTKASKKATSGLSNKLIERRFNKEKEKATAEYYSNKETHNENVGEVIANKQDEKKEKTEEKSERVDNKKERQENERRHKGVIGALGDIGKAILLGALSKLGIGLLSSISGFVSVMASSLIGLMPIIAGLSATILAGFSNIMDGFLGKIIPGYKPKSTTKPSSPDKKSVDVPDKNTSGKTASGKPTQTPTTINDGKPIAQEAPKSPNTVKGIDGVGKTGGVESTAKKPGFFSRVKNMATTVGEVATEAASKGPASKVAAKKMGWLGNAILAFDIAYVITDRTTDGKLSENVDKYTNIANKNIDALKSATTGTLSDAERASLSKEQADVEQKKRDDIKEQRALAAQSANYQKMNVSNKSSTTHVYSSGFSGVQADSKYRMPSNGIQSMR